MANIDCRILAMLALGISLLLLGSMIFLRHYQNHTQPPQYMLPPPMSVPPSRSVPPNSEQESYSEALMEHDISDDTESTAAPPRRHSKKDFHISDACLRCICQVETGCVPKTCAGNVLCGPFRIHESYWIDAGKLTIDDEPLDKAGDSQSDYVACVNNPRCAARTVSEYVRIYSRDCNGDEVIDCADYMLIHHFGPTGCMRNEDVRMELTLDQCLLKSEGRAEDAHTLLWLSK